MVVGERFRIILPQPVRDALGVNVGDQVGFEIRGSTVELYRVEMRRASQ
ncbi:MAG: AbrB/MazE/SpoVT family DNA-binding domain-containing protein [Candidatus Thermoplasmatota archaeon]